MSIDFKVVYRRYASLFFIAGIDLDDNELMALELIQRYVEVLDKWFMNVCELDIIFNFPQAYAILGVSSNLCTLSRIRKLIQYTDELFIAGELQESSKRTVLNALKRIDEVCLESRSRMSTFLTRQFATD